MRKSKLIQYVIENKMENEDFTGEVLWWCDRKGHGIMVTGPENHEVYFDTSVSKQDSFKSGDLVEFNFNTRILDCTCGMNVNKL